MAFYVRRYIRMTPLKRHHVGGPEIVQFAWLWGENLVGPFMEGLNRAFSAVKGKARGYRSSV